MSIKTAATRTGLRQTKPRQLCLLAQLYIHARELSVVISTLTNHGTIMLNGSRHDISDLPDLYLERDLILSRAEAVASRIVLPRWNDLNTVCKQIIRVAYLGTLPNAAFLTINLDAHFAATAIRNKRGPARRIGDTLRDELMKRSLPGSVAINLEEAAQRIRNSPFHIHGIVLIPRELWPSMTQRFKERLAAGYIEHAGNKAVMLKPVDTPGRLAGYVCKDMLEALPANIRRSYASQDLAAPASGFYSELRNWTQQIPGLRESLRPLLPPRPARSECTSAVEQLVAKKLEQTKRQRAQRRRENAALRRRRNTMGRHRRISNHELQSAADAPPNDAAQRSTQSALQHPRKRNKASDIE